jgi:membrane protein CcdC involved in cytochrome C biogenesis
MQTVAMLGSLVGAAAVLTWRVRETQRPVTAKKILIPPLAMSTGFSMFLAPPARVPIPWALGAFLVGAIFFSYPLVYTSELTRVGDDIMLRRSKAFLWILLGLAGVRILARNYVEQVISPMQTGALFFVLAFGMLLPWRITMYRRYRQLAAEPAPAT